MKKVLLIGVEPQSLINFRGPLIRSIEDAGCEVIAVSTPAPEKLIMKFQQSKIKHHSLPFQRNGMNPISDLKSLFSLIKLFRREKPVFVLCYTIKPVIWGGVAARITGTNFYALVTGLGFAFQGKSIRRKLLTVFVSLMYKASLGHATKVIFQNSDNRDVFINQNIIPINKTEVVNGSGIDISTFKYSQIKKPKSGHLIFLCIARLLSEKGLREFAKAASIVKKRYPNIECQILGAQDSSPDSIPIDEVYNWQKNGTIKYLGVVEDVKNVIESCHIFVLPSYHEGLPRSTLEAMSIGRPVITTDAVGCRETVEDNLNGFKVPVSDAKALANKMVWFIENPEQIEPMGLASRKIAEDKFDVKKVNSRMLEIIGLSNEKTV